MGGPCQLCLFANQTVIGTGRSSHHHGIKNLLVLAHHRYGCDLHAHVVQGFGVLQPDAVFLGEGTADRDAEDLRLNRSRCAYGTQVIAIACRELRCNRGWWWAFDGGGLRTVGGDGLLGDDGISR